MLLAYDLRPWYLLLFSLLHEAPSWLGIQNSLEELAQLAETAGLEVYKALKCPH